jgi:DNA-binding transcriptional LysR family regulator
MHSDTNPLDVLGLHHLRALDALLRERSVTAAAASLGLSQSAVSHALRGLREALGDPLFVRGDGAMLPTPRAQALALPVHRALRDLEAALAARVTFEPAQTTRTFRLAMPDGFGATLLPDLLEVLWQRAPNAHIDVQTLDGDLPQMLATGDIDLAFLVGLPNAPELRTRRLFTNDFACVVRRGHPAVCGTLDLDTYCALPHALMSPSGDGPGAVDTALAALGRERDVLLRVRYFLAAPLVVARSDLVLTGPRPLLARMAELAPLQLLTPPVELQNFDTRMFWHQRFDKDAAHRWLRETVVDAVADRSERTRRTRDRAPP